MSVAFSEEASTIVMRAYLGQRFSFEQVLTGSFGWDEGTNFRYRVVFSNDDYPILRSQKSSMLMSRR